MLFEQTFVAACVENSSEARTRAGYRAMTAATTSSPAMDASAVEQRYQPKEVLGNDHARDEDAQSGSSSSSDEQQGGVKRMEAISTTWTTVSLTFAYIGFVHNVIRSKLDPGDLTRFDLVFI
jgi:hypothetical protein